MSVEDFDRAWARFASELQRVRAPVLPAPPEDVQAELAALEAAIAPLRLPAVIRRFWETVDPRTIAIERFAQLMGPGEALELWRDDFEGGACPRVLLPIGYESHQHLSVELDGPDVDDGGALFVWIYTGGGFSFKFATLVDYLDDLVLALQEGRFIRQPHRLLLENEDDYGRPGQAIHPVFGPVDFIEDDVSEWPLSWQLRSNMGPETRIPAGGERTIADVLLDAQFGQINTRIRGTVTELAGSDAGARVTVSDGTGTMRIWCPHRVGGYGPALRGTYEFDITIPADEAPPAPDFGTALRDPIYESLPINIESVIGQLEHGHRPVDATATKVTPIPE